MYSHLLAPYGLVLKLPVAERRPFGPREQLDYVDARFALREAKEPAQRLALLSEIVTIESTARRFDVAFEELAKAEAIATEIGPTAILDTRYLRGKTCYRASRFDQAVKELEAVVAMAGEGSMLGARALLQLGRVHLYQGRFADAIVRLKKGLERDDHTRGNVLGGCFDLVYAYVHEAMRDEAEAMLAKASAIADSKKLSEVARITYYRGWMAFLQRRATAAEALWSQASRELAQVEDHDAWACAEGALARLDLESTELTRCIERCDRARSVPDLRPDIAIVLSLLRGLALLVAGRFPEADSDYQRAERHAERTDRADLRCRALEWQAQLHLVQGAHDRAMEVIDKARHLHATVGDPLGEAMVIGTHAEAYRLASDHNRAATCYEEGRALATRIGNRFELGRIAYDQARACTASGELAAATEYTKTALGIFESLGTMRRYSLCVQQLGVIAALRDDFDEAERLFDRAIELLGHRPNRIVLAETLAARAEARGDAGRIDDATRDLAEACALAETAGATHLAHQLRHKSDSMRERHAAQALLGRYMEPKIAARLLASGPRRLAGNIQQDATILFSDIRGFTTLTERLGAQETVALLNEHFTAMTDEIVAEGGTIDKFIGDAVMAVFGDPGRPRPDDAQRAVRAAIGMIRRRRALDAERATHGQPPIKIGIGIDSGPIVMGSIGSERRLTFTVIGDAVNIASRLETLTKTMEADILISGMTADRLDGTIQTRVLGAIEVKGRIGKVDVRSVVV